MILVSRRLCILFNNFRYTNWPDAAFLSSINSSQICNHVGPGDRIANNEVSLQFPTPTQSIFSAPSISNLTIIAQAFLILKHSNPIPHRCSALPFSLARHHRKHTSSTFPTSTFPTITPFANGTASSAPTCPTYTSLIRQELCPVSAEEKREVCPLAELDITITTTTTIPCSCPAVVPTTTVSGCPAINGCERHTTVTCVFSQFVLLVRYTA